MMPAYDFMAIYVLHNIFGNSVIMYFDSCVNPYNHVVCSQAWYILEGLFVIFGYIECVLIVAQGIDIGMVVEGIWIFQMVGRGVDNPAIRLHVRLTGETNEISWNRLLYERFACFLILAIDGGYKTYFRGHFCWVGFSGGDRYNGRLFLSYLHCKLYYKLYYKLQIERRALKRGKR